MCEGRELGGYAMAETSLLRDLVILFAAALPIVVIFERLNIPAVVGFLIAGIVIGPHGVGLIAHSADVESLADIGLVLLLFVVGLELSFAQLARIGRIAVWAGGLQIVVTTAVAGGAARLAGLPLAESVVLGFLAVQSSTVIVLKILADRDEINAPHGRITVGVLLVQDLCLVPMVLLTRFLSGPATGSGAAVLVVLAKAAAAVGLIVVAARLLLPAALRQIVALRSRELFTGSLILFSLGTAWLAAQFGLSLAIGALIAGLVISESEYSHHAIADILPFRDAFNSIFFISIGMLVHVAFLWNHLPALVAVALLVLVVKAVIAWGVVLPVYPSFRVAVISGISLAALGEVSFVLARFALPSGLLPQAHYEAFVAVAVLTMLAAPFLIRMAPAAAARMQGWLRVVEPVTEQPAPSGNHVVIIGYGLNGENLAHVLRQTGLPYLILEMDPKRVNAARERGEPVRYGDAARPEVLRQAGIATAHAVVVAISDPVATRHIVALTRQSNAHVPLIVRTRYVAEMDELHSLGATEVIPEEYETSVEIFARVLRRLRVPRNVIALQVELIRKQGYRMLRGLELPRQTLDQLGHILAATTIETFMVPRSSPVIGQSIRGLTLRRRTGVTIIAVVRDGQPFTNPSPDWTIQAEDILVMLGSHAQLDRAMRVLGEPQAEDERS
jgi:CPA2 family monovalent cation:H+ antiporter-2